MEALFGPYAGSEMRNCSFPSSLAVGMTENNHPGENERWLL
jgi:hypothetical protein